MYSSIVTRALGYSDRTVFLCTFLLCFPLFVTHAAAVHSRWQVCNGEPLRTPAIAALCTDVGFLTPLSSVLLSRLLHLSVLTCFSKSLTNWNTWGRRVLAE